MMMEEVHYDFSQELIDTQSARWKKIKKSNSLLGIFNVALTSEYTYHDGRIRILLADNQKTGCIEFLKNLFGLNNKETKKLRNSPRVGDAYYWKDIACNIAGRTFSIVSVSLLWYLFYNFLNNVFNKLSPSNKNFQFTFEWNPKSPKTAILATIFFIWLCTKIIKRLDDIVGFHKEKKDIASSHLNRNVFDDNPHENYNDYNKLLEMARQRYNSDCTFTNIAELTEQIDISAETKTKEENFNPECEALRNLNKLFCYLEKYKNKKEYKRWDENYNKIVASTQLINPYITESRVKDSSLGANSYPSDEEIGDEELPLYSWKEKMNTRKNRIEFVYNEIRESKSFLYNDILLSKHNIIEKPTDINNKEKINHITGYEELLGNYEELLRNYIVEAKVRSKINENQFKFYYDDFEKRCKEYCWNENTRLKKEYIESSDLNEELFDNYYENYDTYTQLLEIARQRYNSDCIFDNIAAVTKQIKISAKTKTKEENFNPECEALRNLDKLSYYLEKYKNSEEYKRWDENYNKIVALSKLQLNPYIAQSRVKGSSLDDNSYPPEGTREEELLPYTLKEEMNTRTNRIQFVYNEIRESKSFLYNYILLRTHDIIGKPNNINNKTKINQKDINNTTEINQIEGYEQLLRNYIVKAKVQSEINENEFKVDYDDFEKRCKAYCWNKNEENLAKSILRINVRRTYLLKNFSMI